SPPAAPSDAGRQAAFTRKTTVVSRGRHGLPLLHLTLQSHAPFPTWERNAAYQSFYVCVSVPAEPFSGERVGHIAGRLGQAPPYRAGRQGPGICAPGRDTPPAQRT